MVITIDQWSVDYHPQLPFNWQLSISGQHHYWQSPTKGHHNYNGSWLPAASQYHGTGRNWTISWSATQHYSSIPSQHINGLAQGCGKSSALALELPQPCAKFNGFPRHQVHEPCAKPWLWSATLYQGVSNTGRCSMLQTTHSYTI